MRLEAEYTLSQGEQGPQGEQGIPGEKGEDGTGIADTIYYYKLQSSTATKPSKPTKNPPDGWTTTEPAYTSGSANTLYFVVCTVYSDGHYEFSEVSKSSSYEAAKEAWNKAQNAQEAFDDLEPRVTKAETDISKNGNEISLRATTEEVAEVSNKANDLEHALADAQAVIQQNREALATLTARDFKVEFTRITEQITALNGDLSSYKEEIGNWMRFDADGNLVLGATRVAGQDAYELKLTKNRISFMLNDAEVAYISSNQLYITNSTVVQNLKIGGFTWEVRGNGNLGLVYR